MNIHNGLFINGQWEKGKGELLASISPVDGHVVWRNHSASTGQVELAMQAAKEAHYYWAQRPLMERVQFIENYGKELIAAKEELAQVISAETGKPLWESNGEVQAMINKVQISIQAQEERAGSKGSDALYLEHRPHGVMLVLGPYNFPGHLPNGHIIPALLAGNSVLFKPSEETPFTAIKTLEIWERAGLPAGVINLLQGGRDVGELLCQQSIDGLLFTGASKTGAMFHKQFGGRPEVILALEMGGNNPLIIDENTNLEVAAQIIVRSAFMSAGQRCTCARRLIVVENDQTEVLLEQVAALAQRLIIGAPDQQPEPFMGPVINRRAAANMIKAQRMLIRLGGKPLLELEGIDGFGCMLTPGLIDMTGIQEVPDDEWFGPLLQVYRVKDIESAMRLANKTKFGLSAGLVSNDKSHQTLFLNAIKAGVVTINQPTVGASSAMPFGGVGASGNHRASAYYAADYCAWPQAQMKTEVADQVSEFSTRGISE